MSAHHFPMGAAVTLEDTRMRPATLSQAGRPLQVTTPLGPDVLIPTGFTGREGISQLFHFQVDLLARDRQDIAFENLLGRTVTVRLAYGSGPARYFSGIASCVTQGRSNRAFSYYKVEMVPRLWLLINRAHCRIFQRL